jgi:hypothetical protein
MAAATVVLKDHVVGQGPTKGTYTCDATPSATYVPLGFTPSVVFYHSVTSSSPWGIWSEGMADGTALAMTTAAAAVATLGITPIKGETGEISSGDNTNARPTRGFIVGTNVQTASEVFEFIAFR